MKIIRIQSYSGLYFPVFGLDTERCEESPRIHSECVEMQTRITPNTDTFYAVYKIIEWILSYGTSSLELLNEYRMVE